MRGRRSLLVAAACTIRCVCGILIGASVVPHGDFSVLPSLLPAGSVNRTRAQSLHDAAFAATSIVTAAAPDVILLVAPYAIALSIDFGVYTSSNASGTALIGGDLHNASIQLVPFTVAVRGSPDVAGSLVAALGEQGHNVSAVLPWADSEPAPLRWSEVVPLTFLASLTNTSLDPPPPLLAASGTRTPGVVVWSQPIRRNPCASCMVPELLELGKMIEAAVEPLAERVWIVISADLSHVHPAEVNPYPPNASTANAFDEAVGNWAATLNEDALVVTAAGLADEALSCGFTGLVLLHGALRSGPLGISAWSPKLAAGPSAPTYYGMLVSAVTPSGKRKV